MDTEHIDFITVTKNNAVIDPNDPREGLRLIKGSIPCTLIHHCAIDISDQVEHQPQQKVIIHRIRAADCKILSSPLLHVVFFDFDDTVMVQVLDRLIELVGGQVIKKYQPESGLITSIRIANYNYERFDQLDNPISKRVKFMMEEVC